MIEHLRSDTVFSSAVGAPSWSPDGKRIVYYELAREDTYNAHSSWGADGIESSIVSIDFATAQDRQVHVTGDVLRVNPSYIGNSSIIGYINKGNIYPGVNYTSVSLKVNQHPAIIKFSLLTSTKF